MQENAEISGSHTNEYNQSLQTNFTHEHQQSEEPTDKPLKKMTHTHNTRNVTKNKAAA